MSLRTNYALMQLCTAKVLTMAVSTVMMKLITVFQVFFFDVELMILDFFLKVKY